MSLERTFNYVKEHWNPLNYLFGGTDYNSLRIEIDPLDLFVFFGVIGAFFYLYFIRKCFIKPILNNFTKYLIIGYILISMIYGAFLFNILLMSTLYVFIIYIRSFENDLSIAEEQRVN